MAKSNISFDLASALTIGPKLPINTPFADAAKVMSAAPIEILTKSTPSEIAKNLANVDFNNMGTSKQAAIASRVFILNPWMFFVFYINKI